MDIYGKTVYINKLANILLHETDNDESTTKNYWITNCYYDTGDNEFIFSEK